MCIKYLGFTDMQSPSFVLLILHCLCLTKWISIDRVDISKIMPDYDT